MANPRVWVVPKTESSSSYHEVVWSRTGDLNAGARNGNIRRFRKWTNAKLFAKKKAANLGKKTDLQIHPY